MFKYFKVQLEEVAKQFNERLLNTPHNPISFGMSDNAACDDVVAMVMVMLMLVRCAARTVIENVMVMVFLPRYDIEPVQGQ